MMLVPTLQNVVVQVAIAQDFWDNHKGTPMTGPVVHRNGRRGTATGRPSPYDSSLIEVEWDDGYVTGESPKDLTQESPCMAQ